MSFPTGAVACGHPVTRDAMVQVLRAGGNAFDAVAAGLWAACVAEPLLASPGGGGFLLARTADGRHALYDFFAHTPTRRNPEPAEDFREILVDFGTVTQAFHIGLAAAATPGTVAGTYAFHEDLGSIPMERLMEPALSAAREGVRVTKMQAYVASLLAPILESGEWTRTAYFPDGRMRAEGDVHRQPDLADFLESLSREGPDLFYRGAVARTVEQACREAGGHLRKHDFGEYRPARRKPIEVAHRGHRIRTNPPPASGGLLVAFGLTALAEAGNLPTAAQKKRSRGPSSRSEPAGPASALRTAIILAAMQAIRDGEGLADDIDPERARRVLAPDTVDRYVREARARILGNPPAPGGTTHLSVVDHDGNVAALSVSNGEGCGWAVPGAGFMLNNMLGEADLQPRGFGRWPPDTRLTSMMAPTLVENPGTGRLLALGSGGSNRIRSAIFQVLEGMLDSGLPLAEAVHRPRLHVEGPRLEVEGGFPGDTLAALTETWQEHVIWPERNLFFGGVHAVEAGPRGASGVGDPRRGGVAAEVDRP